MLDPETPLHEIRRMKLAIRDGGDCDGRQASCLIRLSRHAGKFALWETCAEPLICRYGCVDRAVVHAWSNRRAAANADDPRQPWRDSPRILGIEVQVQEVEGLIGGTRKSFGSGRCHTVNELWQSGVLEGGYCALPKVVVIQAKDSGVRGTLAEEVRFFPANYGCYLAQTSALL
jgi:hypothetical protein